MQVKMIRTKKDYQLAMERFEKIFQAKPGTKESEEADVLAILIKNYEDKIFIIDAPDPLDAIRYRMEQQGLSNNDLAEILGYKSRVTDLFNGHRKLNLGMIRKLHDRLHISLETQIRHY